MSDTVVKDEHGIYRTIPEKGGKLEAYQQRRKRLYEAEKAILAILGNTGATIKESIEVLETAKEGLLYRAVDQTAIQKLFETEKRED